MTDVRAVTRRYPIEELTSGPRFTEALVNVVADVIETHGYPNFTDDRDLDALRDALHAFLHRRQP